MNDKDYMPTKEEAGITAAWFIGQGVDQHAATKAMKLAVKVAKKEEKTWREALHLVTNRAVRNNEKGWEDFRGDWVAYQKFMADFRM